MDRLVTSQVYQFIFENSFDAILLTHPTGAIYRANPAACEMFQRTEEELCHLGRSGVVDITDPRLAIALEERLKKGKIRAELNFVRKDGSIFPTEITSTIFQDVDGVTWTVIIVRDISFFKTAESLLRKAQEESAHFAAYDYLTGILNRRAFMERLHQEIYHSIQEHRPLCLLLMDLDYFKQVNDTYGHTCGDEELKFVAGKLSEKLRPHDLLGRYGGDEFIICLPNTTSVEAFMIAESLRIHMENSEFTYEQVLIKPTISVGLASSESSHEIDATQLILHADRNLYKAKVHRNSVCND